MNAGKPRHQPVRSQRGQYVNQACAECKRRKVKCSGTQPCRRCASLSMACIYSKTSQSPQLHSQRSSVPRRMNHSSPCTSTEAIQSSTSRNYMSGMASIQNLAQSSSSDPGHGASSVPGVTPTEALNGAQEESPEFCGPSSSEFALKVVSGSLKARGLSSAILAKSHTESDTTASASRLAQYGPFMKLLTMDPLWDIRKDHALDLINKWFNSMGSIYPVVEYEDMISTAEKVFNVLESAQKEGLKMKKASIAEILFNNETNHMKIVLAIGRTIEGGGQNDQAQRLFQSTTEAVEGLIWNSDGLNGIQLLVLAALYYYHLDEEVRTGRIIGFAARLCLEMGLHRQIMVKNLFPDPKTRLIARKVFFSVYMLERRTSLGQGIPFSIQDSYVDPALFSFHTSNPAFSYLLNWTKLAGQTWQAVNSHGEMGAEIEPVALGYLDYQVIQWYDGIPDSLKINLEALHNGREEPDIHYTKAVLFTRKSHLRNLIYRPVLQSTMRITQYEDLAKIAISVAKEALRFLKDLYDRTVFVNSEPVFFKHLWLTAFGNLLLAAVNSSFKVWDSLRPDFDMALTWIRALSNRSMALMRLWQRLQGLQELQNRLFDHARVEERIEHQGTESVTSNTAASPPLDDLLSIGSHRPLQQYEFLEGMQDTTLSPMVREQLSSFFSTSVGPGSIFEFPFTGWNDNMY